MTLSHAEAMAAITFGQIANAGAPMTYGTFTSNVDMKTGAPAFGTPEQVKASLGAGQLARKLGLPWRCAAGSAANINDAQAAHETEISGWGAFLAGATVIIHSAGWLEGGLTLSYEKLITDMDMVQTFSELCVPPEADDDAIALSALAEVEPGGHFFGAIHTMERYQTAFYDPVGMDWSNIGTWEDRGSQDANTRATAIWKGILRDFVPPPIAVEKIAQLDAYIAQNSFTSLKKADQNARGRVPIWTTKRSVFTSISYLVNRFLHHPTNTNLVVVGPALPRPLNLPM